MGMSDPTNQSTGIGVPQSLTEALDVIRYVASKRHNTTIIIVDEMERVEGDWNAKNSLSSSETFLS